MGKSFNPPRTPGACGQLACHPIPHTPGDEGIGQRENATGATREETGRRHQEDGQERADGSREDNGQRSRPNEELREEVYSDAGQYSRNCAEDTDSQVAGCHGQCHER